MLLGLIIMNSLYLKITYDMQLENDNESLIASHQGLLISFLCLIANYSWIITDKLTSKIIDSALLMVGLYCIYFVVILMTFYNWYTKSNGLYLIDNFYIKLNRAINLVNAFFVTEVLGLNLILLSFSFIILIHYINHLLGYDPIILA